MRKERWNLILIITLVFVNVWLFSQSWEFLLSFLKFIYNLVLPFFLGFVLAFILLPSVDFLVNRKVNRKLSVLIVVVTVLGSVVIIGAIFLPKIGREFINLLENIPNSFSKIQEGVVDFFSGIPLISELVKEHFTEEKMEQFLNGNIQSFIGFLLNFFQSILSYLVKIVLTIVTMIYFLLYFDHILKFVKGKTSEQKHEKMRKYLLEVRDTMRAYFKGVLLVCFILGISAGLGLKIIGVEYAFMIGIFIGITDLIPYLGPYIGGGLAVVVALGDSYKKAIIVIILIIILQSLEAYVLTPKIQSKSVKTNPLLVLFALAFFGTIMGVFGMIIAVPMLAFTLTTIKNITSRGES